MGNRINEVNQHLGQFSGLKKILIISPHFPPSNLTAVHRARFIAQHLPDQGWEPIILTVHEDFYEEALDRNLEAILPSWLRIEKVKALRVIKPRLIGDIGLRAFFSIYRRAKELIRQENIDFVYITIPSFYGALWGRWLHETTGVKYGIDYIDPWVHEFPGSNKIFSRHWFATKLSKFLEPIAIKKASLISGVAASYYEDVIKRNPSIKTQCQFAAIPFGSEASDHFAVRKMNMASYLFDKKPGKIQMVYAGAMLPKAYSLLEEIFKSISLNRSLFEDIEFYFIGTGRVANDENSHTVKPYAEKYDLWENIVFEYPKRIPYLDVLMHLNNAKGVFILGSTEPHYTPSKVYQAVLAEKPIFSVLHRESTAVSVIRDANAGIVLDFEGEEDIPRIGDLFLEKWKTYISFLEKYDPSKVDYTFFELFSAKNITAKLVFELNKANA